MKEILIEEEIMPNELTSALEDFYKDFPGNIIVEEGENNSIKVHIDRYFETDVNSQSYLPEWPNGYLDEYFKEDREYGQELLKNSKEKFMEVVNKKESDYALKLMQEWVDEVKERNPNTNLYTITEPSSDGDSLLWVDLDITIENNDTFLKEKVKVIEDFNEIFMR